MLGALLLQQVSQLNQTLKGVEFHTCFGGVFLSVIEQLKRHPHTECGGFLLGPFAYFEQPLSAAEAALYYRIFWLRAFVLL